MKKYLDIRNFVILFLLLLCLLEFFNPGGYLPNRTVKIPQIDSIPYPVHDTIPVEVEVEVEVPVDRPVEVMVEKLVEVPVIQPVDTMAIVKMFAENKQFKKDVIQLPDNAGTITIFDTISNNRVLGRSFTTKFKAKIIRDTVITPEPIKNVLYVGIDAKFDRPNVVNFLGTSLVYKTKQERLYRVGIGVNNTVIDGTNGTLAPYVGGGIYWPIKRKK